jgi:hypothetical protein
MVTPRGGLSREATRQPTPAADTCASLLLLARCPERLALLALLALLPGLGSERLSTTGPLAGSADTRNLLQARLHVPLAVVRLVRDPLHEVIDVASRVEVRGADLPELVEDLVPQLPPVLPQLLLYLLRLLLIHFITSLPHWRT